MGVDIGTHAASIFSTPPATPRAFPFRTPSTPQSSGSSFSQTCNDTPCPANNASLPLFSYPKAMEGVLLTSPSQANSGQPATSRAPAQEGVSYNSQAATAQPTAVLPPAPWPTPAPQPPQPPPAQPTPHQPASQPQDATGRATAAQPPAVPVNKDAAAPAPAWVTNDPAKVFKAPSWPDAIAPLWATVKALPHLPPGRQVWDAAASAFVWAINDPAQVFKTPSWSVAIAPLWGKVESLSHLPPGTQLWDAAASVYFWAVNDPAQVFEAPSWPSAIAPLWATVQTLPQLPPGTQVWEFKGSMVPAVPQPPTKGDSKPIPADEPVSSHPPTKSPPTNHQPMISSAPAATEVAQEFSFEDSMQALVGLLTTCHVSRPDTWAWAQPNVFGMFIKDKSKRESFHERLVTMANTRLPGSDGNDGLDKVESQQGTQQAVISQSSTALPITEGNGSSSAIPQNSSDLLTTGDNGSPSANPDAMVQEQPSGAVPSQEKPAETQPVEQTHIPFPATPQSGTAADVPTNNDSDEAMETEGSQPADNGKGVAEHGESDLTGSTFQFDNMPQILTGVNNPFVNPPTFPTTMAPVSVQQLGGQVPLFMGPTATGATSQEQTYEVGSDDDPNVDLEFDFGKHFRRAARALAGATDAAPPAPTSPAASSAEVSSSAETFPASSEASSSPEEHSTPEASPPAETPPSSEASSPAGVNVLAEVSTPTELTPPAEVSPALNSPAGPISQPSSSVPVVTVPFSAPTLPSGGLDLSVTGPPPVPRGEKKRIRDAETEWMYDQDCDHYAKVTVLGWTPAEMMQEQYELRKILLAHIKAKAHVAYDEEYALQMMNDMFYDILPRLVSQLLFPLTEWTEADQEDEAKAFVDSMLEEELNERSFEMVQEAYKPSFRVKFPLCRENLFEVFSDWYLKLLAYELPFVMPDMTKKEILNLSEPFEDAIWKYMDDHPPKDRS